MSEGRQGSRSYCKLLTVPTVDFNTPAVLVALAGLPSSLLFKGIKGGIILSICNNDCHPLLLLVLSNILRMTLAAIFPSAFNDLELCLVLLWVLRRFRIVDSTLSLQTLIYSCLLTNGSFDTIGTLIGAKSWYRCDKWGKNHGSVKVDKALSLAWFGFQ